MTKKRKALAITLALVLLAVPLVALADGSVTITGGSLSITPQDVPFGSVAFSFVDQTILDARSLSPFAIEDGRDSPDGFKVLVTATDFTDGLGNTIPTLQADANLIATTDDLSVVCVAASGCDGGLPSDTGGNRIIDPLTPKILLQQALLIAGRGSWTWQMDWDLVIPGGTAPGAYSSVFTVTLVTPGP